MKTMLICKILGHKFLSLVSETSTGSYSHINHYKPVDYCVRCGLNKKEIKEQTSG